MSLTIVFWIFFCFLIILELVIRLCFQFADWNYTFKRKPNSHLPKAKPANYKLVVSFKQHPWIKNFPLIQTISTNNVGMRGDSLTLPKPEEEYRIILLGTSFIADFHHSDESCLTNKIEKLLEGSVSKKKIKVYCASSGGEILEENITLLVHRVLECSPDLIVLVPGSAHIISQIIFKNRMPDLPFLFLHEDEVKEEWKSWMKRLSMIASEFHVARLMHFIYVTLKKKPSFHFGVLSSYFPSPMPSKSFSPHSQLTMHLTRFIKLLNIIKLIADVNNCKLLICAVPFRWKTNEVDEAEESEYFYTRVEYNSKLHYKQHVMASSFKTIEHEMEKFCSCHEIPFCRLEPCIPKQKRMWIDDIHVHGVGSDLAAKSIASFILSNIKLAEKHN